MIKRNLKISKSDLGSTKQEPEKRRLIGRTIIVIHKVINKKTRILKNPNL